LHKPIRALTIDAVQKAKSDIGLPWGRADGYVLWTKFIALQPRNQMGNADRFLLSAGMAACCFTRCSI